MTRKRLLIIALLSVLVLAGLPALLARRAAPVPPQLISSAAPLEGFRRAAPGYRPSLPVDAGAHPNYLLEWWYYTGNLDDGNGRHFGFELTFFRRALVPDDQLAARASAWATDQVYMAHFALTDVAGGRFHSLERFARGSASLAGAQASPYHAWLEDWSVEEIGPQRFRLHAAQDDLSLDLTLVDGKGPALQGDNGYSQKGADPGDASYYYSLTRLQTIGTAGVDNATYQVSGTSWMDHEWSTAAPAGGNVGWDWFALQLSDGSELMLYYLRHADGTHDPFSSGTIISRDGSTRRLSAGDFTITSDATWRSPHSGGVYPARWHVAVPSAGLSLLVEPYLADQELNLSFTYWEGAVRISGQADGGSVSGDGYVELTGYTGALPGTF